ncbi:hypothetical protein C8R45DRAFT_1081181 [Mycena sanguinolenta]|nr:hypothetical protein C8R45DRAFT_1081181 [Mycena sanguinolenta]
MDIDPSVLTGELLVVFIWDILHSLTQDYHIIFKLKFQISTAVYLVSRITSLIFALGFSLFATYPLPDCQAAMIAFTAFIPLSTSSTSLLFFFRIRAIYAGRRLVTYTFGFLWLCLLAGALTVPLGSSATTVGHACIVTRLAPYLSAISIGMTVFDTSVFFAISYGLLANRRTEQPLGECVRSPSQASFSRANLYAFSESLLRDGQQYYLITVVTNTVNILMIYAPGLPLVYRGMWSIPTIAVTNIMASRVFRNIKIRRDGAAILHVDDAHDIHLTLPVISVGIELPTVWDQVVPDALPPSNSGVQIV